MKIVTVTLNPAIDKYLYVDALVPGMLHRVNTVKVYPSGKGINVSLALLEFGIKSVVFGLFGGTTGSFIKHSLENAGLTVGYHEVSGETRTNIKLIEAVSGRATEFNEPGPTVGPESVAAAREHIFNKSSDMDFVVLSGSVPGGFEPGIYADIARQVRNRGARAVVDAEGEALRLAVAAKPFLIKPNRSEAEDLVGFTFKTRSDFKRAAKEILDRGVEAVIISDGPAGAIFAHKGQILWASHAPIGAISPFGCGDALVAGFLASLNVKRPFAEAARFALATATAAALSEGTSFPSSKKVESLLNGVAVEKM